MVKICLVCSRGGHLVEMLRLRKAFEDPNNDVFWISHDDYMTRELRESLSLRAYLIPVRFRLSGLLADMLDIATTEFGIFLREKPDLVVSTGAEICIPICFLAKLFGKRVVFVESLCRVQSLSGTGRIMYRIADLFLVQWPALAIRHSKARYEGSIV